MKRLAIVGALFVAFLAVGVVMPKTAHADVAPGCTSNFLGFPAWYKYLDVGRKTIENDSGVTTTDDCALLGPTTEGSDDFNLVAALPLIGLAVIEILSRLAALVAVGFVMWGGFKYITSQGEPDAAKTARQTITNSLIGLVISLIAVGIVAFLASQLTS